MDEEYDEDIEYVTCKFCGGDYNTDDEAIHYCDEFGYDFCDECAECHEKEHLDDDEEDDEESAICTRCGDKATVAVTSGNYCADCIFLSPERQEALIEIP